MPGGAQVHERDGRCFTFRLNAAFAIGVVLSLPVTLYQLRAFLAPGLYKTERRITLAVIVSGIVSVPERRGPSLHGRRADCAVKWLIRPWNAAPDQPMITLEGERRASGSA